ncbi:hypothetical protein F4780DRAFT_777448 [Xylariomycetidae sp. FL0641]|nr:hypothetical protein F4780DRAFT_777448 [Xylariomycetidae sp. FL0641]
MSAPSAAGAAVKLFRTGKNKVFLPEQSIVLIRPRRPQPPNFAVFKVPLSFNKLDIRDYLLHMYKVPVLAVRSALRYRKPYFHKPSKKTKQPPPSKRMIVEMTQPFVMPPRPTSNEDRKGYVNDQTKTNRAIERRKRGRSARHMLLSRGQKTKGFFRKTKRISKYARAVKKQVNELLNGAPWETDAKSDLRFAEKAEENFQQVSNPGTKVTQDSNSDTKA